LARVELDEAFLSDARRQFEYLAEAEEWSRIDRLDEVIAQLSERLGMFPELGRELARERDRTMRRIPVGQLPYFIWYRYDPRGQGVVRLSRLFHAHQRTPRPRVF
jgi:plasmid stabilization system protein ParE